MDLITALDMVRDERRRQEHLRDAGNLVYTAADEDCPDILRLSALMEEIGEVARCFNDGQSQDELADELAQVAAIAVGWLEAIA